VLYVVSIACDLMWLQQNNVRPVLSIQLRKVVVIVYCPSHRCC